MSKVITINGTDYQLPLAGDPPNWGANLSDIIEALTDVANTVSGPGDILNTNFSIANNVTAPTNITGLIFDSSLVRSAIISYSLDRSTSTQEFSQTGQFYITYNNQSGSWDLGGTAVGDAGVIFSITVNGQIQYISSNISGSNYVGNFVFSAKSSLIFSS